MYDYEYWKAKQKFVNGKDGFAHCSSSTARLVVVFIYLLFFCASDFFWFPHFQLLELETTMAAMQRWHTNLYLSTCRLSPSLTRTFSRRICFFFLLLCACLKQQISHYKFCAVATEFAKYSLLEFTFHRVDYPCVAVSLQRAATSRMPSSGRCVRQ